MSLGILNRYRWQRRAAVGTVFGAVLSCSFAVTDATADKDDAAHRVKTDTPIKHLIVLIGENHSFDNIFATYQPKQGQSVANLLSKGIILTSGQHGPNFIQSQQYQINQPFPATYFIDAIPPATAGKTVYQQSPLTPTFPVPNTAYIPTAPGSLSQGQGPFDSTDVPDALLPTIEASLEKSDLSLLRTGATGLPMFSTDTRVTNAMTLPNGVFEITGSTLPYDSYTGDMVHRLFHMWQQSDCNVNNAPPDGSNPTGCLNDLYPFVGVARNDGSGANSMGFVNMLNGDAPVFKKIANAYTINDNYHQPVMGGTAVQHIMIGTADAIPWDTFQGVTQPPTAKVADPDPKSSKDVSFQRDQAWTNCSDLTQPGIPAIVNYLATLPWHPSPNCESGLFYMINNLSPGFLPNGNIDAASILAGSKVPPSSLRTIGDALNEKKISWAYYGGGYNAAVRVANGSTDPVDKLIGANYCDICNPFGYVNSIMGDPTQRKAHIKDAIDFFSELDQGHLPSISYVKPDSLVDGHPASSKLDLFEAMLENILDKLKAHPDLFKETAFIVTFDEGGGYWDSGFYQPLDFFGDGPRIPLVVISPFSRGGKVVHSYNDHASVVKFIERNWDLKPLTPRSRDNLHNPKMSSVNPYVPVNMPAVGDLFDMFDFDHGE
jgi:phospholipase C